MGGHLLEIALWQELNAGGGAEAGDIPVGLPVPFLQYAYVGSIAFRTHVRLAFFEENDGRAALVMGKCIDQHVVSRKVNLDDLTTLFAMSGQKAEAGVVLAHSPADLT